MYLHVFRHTDWSALAGISGAEGASDQTISAMLSHPSALLEAVISAPSALAEDQYLFDCHRVRVAGGNGVVRTAKAYGQAASFSVFQGISRVAAHLDSRGSCCHGRNDVCSCEHDCCNRGSDSFLQYHSCFFLWF